MASSKADAQVMQIGSELGKRLDHLARQVAALVQANVAFYKTAPVVTGDELLASSTANIRLLVDGLCAGQPFV